jgi:hypothetical protein
VVSSHGCPNAPSTAVTRTGMRRATTASIGARRK